MIIINSNDTDQSTNDIVDWLKYYNAEYRRINYKDKLRIKSISINNGIYFELLFLSTGELIKSTEISFFWYRRGDLNIEIECDIIEQDFLQKEQVRLKQLVYYYLVNRIPSIGNFYDNYINKLIVLSEAENLGITIPKTIITSSKEALIRFKLQEKNIITKAIDNSMYGETTTIVSKQAIKSSKQHFFYTLFQSYTDKFIELRIFFLMDKFWTTAIFSQNDEQTKVDFRNYNYANPNRLIPFKLPTQVKKKLHRLNQKLKLTSGSIDMILTPDEQYVLLEINPIGQFRNFSYFNNFNLEKNIAEYILQNERKIVAT